MPAIALRRMVRGGDVIKTAINVFSVFALLVCCISWGAEADNATVSNQITFNYCGKWPNHARGRVMGFDSAGNYIYAALPGAGLVIYQISSSGDLVQKGILPVRGAWDVHVQDHYAYLAQDSKGLAIVDVEYPHDPILVGQYTDSRHAQVIAVAGKIAAVSDRTDGIHLVDISVPSKPARLGTCESTNGAFDLHLSQNFLFVATQELEVWDVRDPSKPCKVGQFKTRGNALSVATSGKYVYVVDGGNGLQVLDASDPTKLALVGRFAPSEGSLEHWNKVLVKNNHAFLMGGTLQELDVRDPAKPQRLSRGEFAHCGAVAGDGKHLVIYDDDGLKTIDLRQANPFRAKLAYSMSGSAIDVKIKGQYAFLAYGSGLQVLDIANPSSPRPLASAETIGFAKKICLDEKNAYVMEYYCPDGPPRPDISTNSLGLQIYDISTPNRPIKVNRSSLTMHTHFSDFALAGKWGFIIDNSKNVIVVDLQSPESPRYCPSLDIMGQEHCRGLCVSGSHLFTLFGSPDSGIDLQIYKLGFPSSPALAGQYPEPSKDGKTNRMYPFGIATAGHYAYLAEITGEFKILDVSNLQKPALAGSCSFGSGSSYPPVLHVQEQRAFIVDDNGLKVVDVRNPRHPVCIGEHALKGHPTSIQVVGNHAYVCLNGELLIFEIVSH